MSYLSIIQKDLPLAVWGLDETPDSIAASDTFINLNGTYSAPQSSKSFPFVYGSSRSIVLDDNDTEGYALKIPSLDRLSAKSKTEPFSIEFWIKFIDKDFVAPTSPVKIMGKVGHSHTGVYIHNSSIVATVGDTSGTFTSSSVSLANIKRPMHVVMSYLNGTVNLFVNGQMSTSKTVSGLISNEYDSNDEYFVFYALDSGLKYALDNVAIYSRALDVQTVRRHIAYGFGYELPNQVLSNFGGTRYSLSMSDTKPVSAYEQSWFGYSSINNLSNNNGYLTVRNINQPSLKFAKDKSDTVFSYDSDALYTVAGGYIEIESPILEAGGLEHGFGFTVYKNASITTLQSVAYIPNRYDVSKYLHFFIENNILKYDLNGTIATLKSLSTTEEINFGYFYDMGSLEITVFCSGGESDTISDKKFYPYYIRMLSLPKFSDKEVYSSDNVAINVGVKKIFNIKSASISGTELNEYKATVNSDEKRFVMSAYGEYVFSVPATRLSGINPNIGNHVVSWGYDGEEVVVSATGSNLTWLPETTLENRKQIPDLVGKEASSNSIEFKISISANDIENNLPKVFFFRIFTYDTDSGATTIVSDGPDLVVDNDCILPDRESLPFLYNEEFGGLYVGGTAEINFSSAPLYLDEDTQYIRSIAFFINPSTTSADILSCGSNTITYSSGTLSGASFYINGQSGSSLPSNEWSHVVVIFNTEAPIPSDIVFGGTTSGFYLDEIIVCGKELTSDDSQSLFNLYRGSNSHVVISDGLGGSDEASIAIVDSEISNPNYTPAEYQPLNNEQYLTFPVNFVTSTKPGNYISTSSLVVDGQIVSPGDKILVKEGTDKGIYTVVSTLTKNSAIVGSVATPTDNTLTYVSEGAVGKGKYYLWSGGAWSEVLASTKIKVYSVSSNPPLFVDAYSSIER